MRNPICWMLIIIGILYLITALDKTGNKIKQTKWTSNIIAFFLIILLGLRREDIGIDTPTYFYVYSNYIIEETVESGFIVFSNALRFFNLPFYFLTIFEACIYIIPINCLIKKYSSNIFISYLLFVCFDYYFISMTAMRQSIAMGFSLYAWMLAMEKKPFLFALFSVIAISFHASAIIILGYYFIPKIKHSAFSLTIYIGSFLFIFLFFQILQALLVSYGRLEYVSLQTGGLGTYAFYLFIALFELLYPQENKKSNIIFINMLLFAILLYPLLRFNPTLFRLHYYYSIALIILIPNLFSRITPILIKAPLVLVVLVVTAYYSSAYTMENFDVIPYYFFWEKTPRISTYNLTH